MTDRLLRYALLGDPLQLSQLPSTVKLLRLGVFGPNDITSGSLSLRVYFVDDTTDAFEVTLADMTVDLTQTIATGSHVCINNITWFANFCHTVRKMWQHWNAR